MELKDVFTATGYSPKEGEEPTLEAFQSHLKSNFVGVNVAHENPDIIKKVTGKALGSVTTELKRSFKDLGVEFEEGELKDKKVEEIIELGKGKLAGQIQALKETANKTDDKKAQQLQTELEKIKTDYTQALSQRDKLKAEKDELAGSFEGYKKQLQIDTKWQDARSKTPWTDSLPKEVLPIALKGFENSFKEKYKIELSDTQDSPDGLRIIDAQTGQRVASGNNFTPLSELIQVEAKAAGLLKMSGGGTGQRQPGGAPTYKAQNTEKGANGLPLNPALQKRMAELNANG